MLKLAKTHFTISEACVLCWETANRFHDWPHIVKPCEAAINLLKSGKGDPQEVFENFRDTFATYLPEMWPVITLIQRLYPSVW